MLPIFLQRRAKRSLISFNFSMLVILALLLCSALASCGSNGQTTANVQSTPTPTFHLILHPTAEEFASSYKTPALQFPEGITSWDGKVYTATYNVVNPKESRILVYDAYTGALVSTLGGKPGQELISGGALLGLTIDPKTGYLYCAANFAGQILQIKNPASALPQISVYATYPKGGGPEDLVFGKDGTLYGSDSNLGVVYDIPPGGGKLNLLIGPTKSGAPISDNNLFASSVPGLSPNGIVFSADWRTFYVANTWANSIIAFDVNDAGKITGNARTFAQIKNDDLHEYPTGFDALKRKDTKIGPSATTPLNGPDGMAVDVQGHIYVACTFGDNITVLDPKTGQVITTLGNSAVTDGGLMNAPAGETFVGNTLYTSNMSIFTGLAGKPKLPFRLVSFNVGVPGLGGNGNH